MDNDHYDAVIIGSGFGGSVMAYRLAEAGLRVCLLERGKAYPPNSFPRTPHGLRHNFWDPSEGLYGMYNVWSFKGSGALVASGLGGGSLIYANIIIRKDEKWFVKEDLSNGGYEYWPVTRADLDPHYERVERMLNVQKYPLSHPPYDKTLKTLAMQEAAQTLGLDWQLVNLAVSFRVKPVDDPDHPDDVNNTPLVGEPIEERHRNIHNMTRYTCRLCGECDFGCNYGSKNTLDYTYISEAHRLGAQVRTLCEVKTIAPCHDGNGRGYVVTYVVHEPERFAGKKIDTHDPRVRPRYTLTCDFLILAAGTFGTAYLLLKNRAAFPNLSPRLGSRFGVNGDLLAFIVKSMERKNGRNVPRVLDPCYGPVITSAIRLSDTLDGDGEQGRGFYVEEGGNPYLLSWMVELSGFPSFLRRALHFLKIIAKYRLGLSVDADLGAEIADLIGPANASKSSIPVLTMGRDIPNGNLFLKKERLESDWEIKKSQEYYDRVRRVVKTIARALHAEYLDNPSYAWNFHQVISAHPLGGCPMGISKDQGVVNPWGEVFDYPGLYIADGAVMPGPVGPNPSLTIAALSDRFADHIVARHQGSMSGST
jgi:cholesterol oxidase